MVDIRDLGRASLAAAGLLMLPGVAAPAWAGTTERVSVGPHGRQANGNSDSAGDLGGRALRRLRVRRHQPRPGRHRRLDRRLRPRPPDRHDRAGERRRRTARQATGPASPRRSRRDGRFVAFSSEPQPRPGRHQRPSTTSSSATARRARPSGSASASGGVQGNGDSSDLPAGDLGRRALRRLRSYATNLVPGDTNGVDGRLRPRPPDRHDRAGERRVGRRQADSDSDIARRSRRTGASSPSILRHQPRPGRHQRLDRRLRPRPQAGHDRAGRASARAGCRRTATASAPALSADGRFVAFYSDATNLVQGDTNGVDRRLRPRPQAGHHRAGERRAARPAGQRRQRHAGALGGRALRRLRLVRHQPRPGRHQRSPTSSSATARRARPSGSACRRAASRATTAAAA